MYYSLNRTVCDVLAEMRACHKTRNYSILPSLIEECQTLANRMESALCDVKDIKALRKKIKELKDELNDLEAYKERMNKLVPKEIK